MIVLDLTMVIAAALLFGAGMAAMKVRAPKRLITLLYTASALVIVVAVVTIHVPRPGGH